MVVTFPTITVELHVDFFKPEKENTADENMVSQDVKPLVKGRAYLPGHVKLCPSQLDFLARVFKRRSMSPLLRSVLTGGSTFRRALLT